MAYDRVIDLAGRRADGMGSLLCRSLQRYSEYEHDLCKKEYNDSEDSDNVARYFIQSNSDGSSDDTAGKNDRISCSILYKASVNA